MLRSAGVVGFMTLLSRLTGILQSRIVASVLGLSGAADAFNVAYRIPNLLRRFTAEGTMTSAFLPTLTETEAQEGEAAVQKLVAQFLGTLGFCLVLICALGILAMGLITGLMMLGRFAPGHSIPHQLGQFAQAMVGLRAVPPDVALTTTLGRWMFPYLGMVSLTAGLAAALNLRGRFGLPASVSTFYNLAFIATGWLCLKLGPERWREPETAAYLFAAATLSGGLVQLLVLWPSFRRLGFGIQWGFYWKHPGVRRALTRMAPGLLGTGIHPINVVLSTLLASQLFEGAQTVLFNANMLGEAVLGLFATSVATVSLPAMSRIVETGDMDELRHSLATALRGTAVLAIPASVGMAVLAQPIIALTLRTGRFDGRAVSLTAATLAFQAVGLLFIASGRIAAQCLYALKDYRTPAYAALLSMVGNLVLSYLLMKPLSTGGIALANGLASLLGLTWLSLRLRKPLQGLPSREVLKGWLPMAAASALMGLAVWQLGRALDVYRFHGVWGTAQRLFPVIALGALLYFALIYAFGLPESRQLANLVKRKILRR
ncbi:MAG: murein biosynthesis integral membrane protein MurJ [Firmicutes bacterium]|nr:murein biosynthesis integral membrane protein MurJ [Bacillota bacterium]